MFAQCLIIKAHDPSTNLFVPRACALVTSKAVHLYRTVLHEITVLLTYNWTSKIVYYAKALHNGVKYDFPKMHVIGCYFYFTQGLFRKMKKIYIFD
ncbi:hypothetical protein MXB_4193 [Myxobolus squamalis]|nr:hypothetical protein MXB_4193 [Myxobolus squamalis]